MKSPSRMKDWRKEKKMVSAVTQQADVAEKMFDDVPIKFVCTNIDLSAPLKPILTYHTYQEGLFVLRSGKTSTFGLLGRNGGGISGDLRRLLGASTGWGDKLWWLRGGNNWGWQRSATVINLQPLTHRTCKKHWKDRSYSRSSLILERTMRSWWKGVQSVWYYWKNVAWFLIQSNTRSTCRRRIAYDNYVTDIWSLPLLLCKVVTNSPTLFI